MVHLADLLFMNELRKKSRGKKQDYNLIYTLISKNKNKVISVKPYKNNFNVNFFLRKTSTKNKFKSTGFGLFKTLS